MNAHTPFDANQDWTNPYCQNSSNDPMVDALLGNAYHVVRTVYCNLGNLKLIYDFLNKYGMVLGVQSEAELKAMPTSASYVRLYGFDNTNKRVVTDYLYVEGDRTGVIPDDPSATGSWILVATSNSDSGGDGDDGKASPPYIPYSYNNGSAIGGETSIPVPVGTVGVPMIVVGGYTNLVGYGFTYDPATLTVTLAQPLEPGDEVHLFLTGTPAVPDNPNVTDWVQINWLYNGGYAVGGEQVITIPYTFESVPAIYKNGERYYAGLADKSYTVDAVNQRILLTEPLATNDRLIVTIGGESTTLIMSDRTVQEVARSANVKDSEVILSSNTTQYLNDMKVVYDVVAQKIYGLPTLPTNIYINSVSNGQLTYSPGNITVDLLPVPNSAEVLREDLNDINKGADLVAFDTGMKSRLVSSKLSDVYTAKDAGITGDGSDETSKLLNLINNRNGRIVDLQGLTVAYSGFSISLTDDLVLTNGKLLYIGTETAFASKINTTALIALKNIKLDGASVVAKGLFLNATANTARLWVSEYEGTNFRETTTGLAAGLYATSDASVYWDEILLDNVRVRDVSNAGTGTNVGRGVMIQNFRYANCTRLDVRRVAPYQDADGIYASSPNYPEAVFVCGNSYFEDCQKRSVKSQVMNSHVFNITEKLTQGFTAGAGQSAVDLQAGGSLNGLTCFYADGAARQSIVAGGFVGGTPSFRGVSLRNIDVNCDDPTDVIPRMVSLFNNSAETYDGFVVENFKCNCLIENMGFLYSNVGNSQPSVYIFKEVIFRNIQASGFTNSAKAAVLQVSRGAPQYVKALVRVQNCNLGDGTTAPVTYLDPAPGSTSFLEVLYRQIDNCRGFNVKNPVNTDTAARVYVQTLDINEDGTGSITVPVVAELGRTTLKVTALYNSNRDTVGAKLFTEGVWMQGATTGVYIETLPGVKTNTNTGSIAVTASGSNIVVTKTGGTTTAGGRLTLILIHHGAV